MSSHQDWQEAVISEHALAKPFAPENGKPLMFKAGDSVIFTNDYGVEFRLRVTGTHCPEVANSLYARGARYLLDSDSPWMPVSEASLRRDQDAPAAR